MKVFLLSLLVMILNAPLIANGCFQVERDALLTFKAGLQDPGNLTSSWHSQDCCNWSGVTCDQLTKHVVKLNLRNPYVWDGSYSSDRYSWESNAFIGEINASLLSLRYLSHLDLSNHNFFNAKIPEFIGSFGNLIYLNLSFSFLRGVIPNELGNLTRLQFLDLGGSIFLGMIPPQIGNLSNLQYLSFSQCLYLMGDIGSLSWLYRLSNLRYLDMTGADLNNKVDWSKINKMRLLETLIFSDCNLSEISIEPSHVNLTSLKKLDLSLNTFHDKLPNWLWNLTSLLYLNLKSSEYYGSFPRALSNLVSLNYLSLGGNYFEHMLLEPISKLHNLRSLDLSSLEIGGDIANLIIRLGSTWYNLEVVHLHGNSLSGNISNWIGKMKNLSVVDLSSNLLSGHIPSEIGQLTQLKELYLNDNFLSGDITENHFVSISNLDILDLSGNMLTVKMNEKWVPPFQLKSLSLSSCKVGPPFPSWLQGQMQLRSVELSNTSIFGAIPIWFWNGPLQSVDLSYNKINNLGGFNNVSGSLSSWDTLKDLDLSNNQLDGSILNDICKLSGLAFLVLSNNGIYGEIPICWKNLSNFETVDLSNNEIIGQLPFSIGSWQYLEILQLDNNKLHGEIPSTLQQCNMLQFLSLGRNNFSGAIPSWIGKQLQYLVVLQLRSNKFTGLIPSELGELSNLQILDLSNNSLVGPIPSSVGNFYGMKNTSSQFFSSSSDGFGIASMYDGTLYIDINGQENYTSRPLDFAKVIDFSGNSLSGQVPKEIWSLQGVIYLNLSRNYFMGEIPETIGWMGSLEFLDLSFNNFSGPIPQSLSSLSSLHNLNLSYNNFSGKIPTGRQLDTISAPSVYVGNPYLCGPPLDKNCSDNQVSRGTDSTHGDNKRETVWFYLVVALGFILGFWLVWGVLIFIDAWKTAYFQMIDALFDKMYVYVVLAIRWFA